MEDALALLEDAQGSEDKLNFTFSTKFGSNEFATDFSYCKIEGVPGRINAIIGYNGTGKTQLLANLAWVAKGDKQSREGKDGTTKYGYLEPAKLRFGGVVGYLV